MRDSQPSLDQAWTLEAQRLGATSLVLGALDWSHGPDRARDWVPEKLLPLFGCAGYGALTPSQRRTYNQAYAAQLLEEFIWIERRLIVEPLTRLVEGLSGDAKTVIESFLTDERHHIACFSRLRESVWEHKMFAPPRDVEALAGFAGRWPRKVTFWTDVIATFEEYALDIAKQYNEDSALDPLFREAFVAHARDEARHCRFDKLLQAWLPPNGLNMKMGAFFSRAYYATDWGLDGPVKELVRRFPDLTEQERALCAEARIARHVKLTAQL